MSATMDIFSGIEMEKRRGVRLERVQGQRNRVEEVGESTLWFDLAAFCDASDPPAIFRHAVCARYTGFIAPASVFHRTAAWIPAGVQLILHVRSVDELNQCIDAGTGTVSGKTVDVVSSGDPTVLARARELGIKTCFRPLVDDGASLHAVVAQAAEYDFLLVSFRDPTNIPLELFIATLQSTRTILIKELLNPADIDDAIVTLGVMEVGAEGVAFSPDQASVMDALESKLSSVNAGAISLTTGTIIDSRPVGMGYRSCIDVATLFSQTEGMLVGSTSHGGILCCPEVFFLPYMELRPFRINAGAVHSYVYGFNDRTDYMTELKSGSPIMVVDKNGRTRRACVGRMKTELRPLRLIEVAFGPEKVVSILMQDDWHVRVFSDEGKPLNITELKKGDKVLGHATDPGRHVGIRVNEHIIES